MIRYTAEAANRCLTRTALFCCPVDRDTEQFHFFGGIECKWGAYVCEDGSSSVVTSDEMDKHLSSQSATGSARRAYVRGFDTKYFTPSSTAATQAVQGRSNEATNGFVSNATIFGEAWAEIHLQTWRRRLSRKCSGLGMASIIEGAERCPVRYFHCQANDISCFARQPRFTFPSPHVSCATLSKTTAIYPLCRARTRGGVSSGSFLPVCERMQEGPRTQPDTWTSLRISKQK